ncbi:glycoside hydrolase family 17 protein [Gaetbulibacter aestuarii]|uniref:Endo-1,3-beta-glucanase btgC n=1 Tax=Gaetbulibacter aestuarii TaxID=1502358 RepID=A0ABW7MW91_9FLAO
MSLKTNRILALTGGEVNSKTLNGLQNLFGRILKQGIHGLCFTPYVEGQKPGSQLTEKQIRRRLKIIKPYTNWVRSFSCTDGNELIPVIAKELGMKTFAGAWLGTDLEVNKKEIENLVKLAKSGHVDMASVGNEVLFRKDLTETQLLEYIQDVKQQIPDTTLTYVDAYHQFSTTPKLIELSDVVSVNCYPYWEGCSIDYALIYIKDMYQQTKKIAQGKPVIIAETGWPSVGEPLHDAVPSFENAIKAFANTQLWARDEGVDLFYFSAFDESWKIGEEGTVGAHWGLWDKNEQAKYHKTGFLSKKIKAII